MRPLLLLVLSLVTFAGSAAAQTAREIPIAELPEQTVAAQTADTGALSLGTTYARAALIAALADQARNAGEGVGKLAARTQDRFAAGELSALAKHVQYARDPAVVSELALLGPFQDTGGGLQRAEAPEAQGFVWTDKDDYSWGSMQNRWRIVPSGFVRPLGVPLDAFVQPRAESCSYVVTFVELAADTTFHARAAGTGGLALFVDGKRIADSDELHARALFDRLGARVQAQKGQHSIAAKVCSGPLGDAGMVRLRLLSSDGNPLRATTRAHITGALASSKASAEPVPLDTALKQVSDTGRLILLTAAGADDAKSPRASGVAENLARAANASDPSGAALCAWLSPSRGLRSEIALRMRQQGVLGTFFARRAVEAALAGNLVDYAYALYTGAKLDRAKDAEAIMLGARIEEGTGSEVLRHQAQVAVAAAIKGGVGSLPDALLGWHAGHAATPNEARVAALELDRRGVRGAYLVQALGALEARQGLLARATAMFEGRADRGDDLVAALRYLDGHGLAKEARALASVLVQRFAPNRGDAFEVYANLAKRAGDTGEVPAALLRAAVLAPGEARLRAELAFRADAMSESSEKRARPWDEKYLVSSERALAHRKDKATADFAERELYWLRAVELHDDGRVSQMMHYTREIGIASRSDDDRYENLPAEADLTEILRARVHRKDGTLAFPVEEHADANDTRLKWPALERGDVVEVAVRQWTERSVGGRRDPPFYFLDYGASTETRPLLENAVVVAYPKKSDGEGAKKLHLSVVRPGDMTRQERDEAGRHVIELRWAKPKNVPDEPLSPPMSEIVPLVVGSSYGSWADFFRWYNEAVRRFADPDDEVKRLAAELTRGKTTQNDKVKALFDFVADKIRYVNYVSGEWWLPNRPQEVLARREGDCDDKALLLISLLAAVGIHAEEVLVQTRMTGMPSVLDAPGVAAPLFDHGIAYLPGPGGGTYLDATSPASRLGPLPAMDTRAPAARIDNQTILRLPDARPEDHGRLARYTIDLQASGAATLSVNETHSGDAAFFLRTEMQEAGARNNYVEDRLLGPFVPTAKVSSEVSFKPEVVEVGTTRWNARGKAEVSYKAEALALARRDADSLVLGLSRDTSLTTTYAPLAKRTLPLVLPPDVAPSHDIREMAIKAPPGFVATAVPREGKLEDSRFGRASVTTKMQNGRLVVRRELLLDQHRIEPDAYPAFRKFLQDADALLRQSVRFGKVGAQ